ETPLTAGMHALQHGHHSCPIHRLVRRSYVGQRFHIGINIDAVVPHADIVVSREFLIPALCGHRVVESSLLLRIGFRTPFEHCDETLAVMIIGLIPMTMKLAARSRKQHGFCLAYLKSESQPFELLASSTKRFSAARIG